MTQSRDPNAVLRNILDAGIDAVSPARALPPHLPPRPASGRVLVLGAGKASAHMAKALEDAWAPSPEDPPLEGVVTVPPGHEAQTRWIEVSHASHPTPDARSQAAAERALALAETLGEGDTLVGLISGGGSALWCAPKGITLEEKQAMTRRLLADGTPIGEINRIRKQNSRIKGGGLARAAWPARTIAFAISDVPNDDPAVIASGPCSPPPGDPKGDRASATLIAGAGDAIAAAADAARAAGIEPVILGLHVEGEAREVAARHAALALEKQAQAQGPLVLLSGGELTVTVRGKGRGGRNTEYVLALALALNGAPGVHALAADTDGVDGNAGAAGARCAPDTLARARAAGLDPQAALDGSDSAGLFAALGDLVDTGPTGTNVSDLRAILVTPEAEKPSYELVTPPGLCFDDGDYGASRCRLATIILRPPPGGRFFLSIFRCGCSDSGSAPLPAAPICGKSRTGRQTDDHPVQNRALSAPRRSAERISRLGRFGRG